MSKRKPTEVRMKTNYELMNEKVNVRGVTIVDGDGRTYSYPHDNHMVTRSKLYNMIQCCDKHIARLNKARTGMLSVLNRDEYNLHGLTETEYVEVVDYLEQGRNITAIKAYRDYVGASIRACKEIIESIGHDQGLFKDGWIKQA